MGIQHLSANPSLMGSGATFIDYNMDGWLDIFMTGGAAPDKLYRNFEGKHYIDVSAELPYRDDNYISSGAIAGDLNNDGCPDIFITSFSPSFPNILLQNNCDGTFSDISNFANIKDISSSMGATFMDYNKDGLLDIYVINYVSGFETIYDENGEFEAFNHTCYENFLYENRGNDLFVEVAQERKINSIGCGLAVTTLPFQGETGIYIANDFGEWLTPNEFYVYNPDSQFFENKAVELGLDYGLNGMGIAIGDYDHDLDFDVYVTNLGKNILLENKNGIYEDVAPELKVENGIADDGFLTTGWGAIFYDMENDKDLDLVVAQGFVETGAEFQNTILDKNKLYRKLDNGYQDVSSEMGINDNGFNRGVLSGDIDNDGDLDLLFTTVNYIKVDDDSDLTFKLFRNDNPQGNFLDILLKGEENGLQDMYGSIVHLYSGGEEYMQYFYSSGTHASHSSDYIHFGLGQNENIDSVLVQWVTGDTTTLRDLPINQRVRIQLKSNTVYEVIGCTDPQDIYFNSMATYNQGCMEPTSSITPSLHRNVRIAPSIVQDGIPINILPDNNTKIEKIVVWDIHGIVLKEYSPYNRTVSLDAFPPGIYFISIELTHNTITQKVLKSN